MVAETSFLDSAVTREVGSDAKVSTHETASAKARQESFPEREMPTKLGEVRGWISEFVKNLVGGSETETKDGPQDREHRPGDVWLSGDKFMAKNQKGDSGSFDTRDSAKDFAAGRGKTGAAAWDFTPWKLVRSF